MVILQFSSRDEYRYHEALVHPGLATVDDPRRVLVLGGGDGLAVREILTHPGVDSVHLVDLDPAVTRLFSSHEKLIELNKSSLLSPKVKVFNEDAFRWIKQQKRTYDLIILDFPDPSNFSLGKLYSLRFFNELNRILAPEGKAIIQSTSPLVARQSFWCINHTLEAAGFTTLPYHVYVPSFGEWGFVLCGKGDFESPKNFKEGLKFVTPNTWAHMSQFPPDMDKVPTTINRLNEQSLVQYFAKEWAAYE